MIIASSVAAVSIPANSQELTVWQGRITLTTDRYNEWHDDPPGTSGALKQQAQSSGTFTLNVDEYGFIRGQGAGKTDVTAQLTYSGSRGTCTDDFESSKDFTFNIYGGPVREDETATRLYGLDFGFRHEFFEEILECYLPDGGRAYHSLGFLMLLEDKNIVMELKDGEIFETRVIDPPGSVEESGNLIITLRSSGSGPPPDIGNGDTDCPDIEGDLRRIYRTVWNPLTGECDSLPGKGGECDQKYMIYWPSSGRCVPPVCPPWSDEEIRNARLSDGTCDTNYECPSTDDPNYQTCLDYKRLEQECKQYMDSFDPSEYTYPGTCKVVPCPPTCISDDAVIIRGKPGPTWPRNPDDWTPGYVRNPNLECIPGVGVIEEFCKSLHPHSNIGYSIPSIISGARG